MFSLVTTSRLDGRISVLSSTTATTEEVEDDATEEMETEDIADEAAADDMAWLDDPPVLTGVDEVLLPELPLLLSHAASMAAKLNSKYLDKFRRYIRGSQKLN